MRTLRYLGDPVLRRKATPVAAVDEAIRRLAADMTAVMREAGGIGLAANQVGALHRVILVDVSAGKDAAALRIVLNPRIARSDGSHTDEEGCLSLPGLRAPVRRAMTARIEGMGMDGQPVAIETAGLEARAFQHEIDHLNGILFIDRLPIMKKIRMWKELRRLKKHYAKIRKEQDSTSTAEVRSQSESSGLA